MSLQGDEREGLPAWGISWRLMFGVKTGTKALSKIEEVRRAFERDIEVSVCERYWKDQSLWDCQIRVVALGSSNAEIVFDCLMLASRLGNGWSILGLGENIPLQSFSGVFNANPRGTGTPSLLGLDWASFELSPLEGLDDDAED